MVYIHTYNNIYTYLAETHYFTRFFLKYKINLRSPLLGFDHWPDWSQLPPGGVYVSFLQEKNQKSNGYMGKRQTGLQLKGSASGWQNLLRTHGIIICKKITYTHAKDTVAHIRVW